MLDMSKKVPHDLRKLKRDLRFGLPRKTENDATLRHRASLLGFYIAVFASHMPKEDQWIIENVELTVPRIESWPLIKPVNDKPMMQLCPIATIDLFMQALAAREPALYELGEMNYLRALAAETEG